MKAGLRMTDDEYRAFLAKRPTAPVAQPAIPEAVVLPKPLVVPREKLPDDVAKLVRADKAKKAFQAKGRLPKGTMNDTEFAYAEVLEEERRAGKIKWWKFHALRVRLANNAYYEVDFLVMASDDVLEIRETKGSFVTDKGQLKIRLCAEALPIFRIFKVTKLNKKQGGGFKIEEYTAK